MKAAICLLFAGLLSAPLGQCAEEPVPIYTGLTNGTIADLCWFWEKATGFTVTNKDKLPGRVTLNRRFSSPDELARHVEKVLNDEFRLKIELDQTTKKATIVPSNAEEKN